MADTADNISNLYDNMFDPYSSVWEVSGKTMPLWTWQGIDSESTDENGNKIYKRTIGYAEVPNDAGGKSSYDIKTDNVVAPFSQFSRWLMLDYSGINGVLYSGDRQIVSRYFDNGLARAGHMWSDMEPTYANIIKAFEDIDAGRYRVQDFIYNKYFNKIPTNYLVTLRRYPMACTDSPFTLAYSEELHKNLQSRSVLLPVATATTYMSEVAGNKMDDLLKFTFGLNFSEKTSELQVIPSGTPGATGFGIGRKLFDATNDDNPLVAGFAVSATNAYANTNYTPGQMQVASQYAQVDPWAKYTKYTNGPVDIIMKTKIRDQGINFSNDFNLKFEYELKSLRYVNPKIAMLDIIGNMLSMGTNTGSFWGGATRYYGNGGGFGKQPGDLSAFARGDYATYAKSLVDHVTNQVKSMNGGDWPNSLASWVELAKNIFTGGLNNMIGSLINGNLGQMGFTQPANALLNDEPTGYWHITIGNPLNPIAMMGNMICTDWQMTMGEGLGYDDFPVNCEFTCKVTHGKPRDESAIEAIFNAGKGRFMHTPFTGDLDRLPEDMKKDIEALANQMKNKHDAMHTSGGVSDPNNKNNNKITTPKKFSQSDSNGVKHIKEQIDTVLSIIS